MALKIHLDIIWEEGIFPAFARHILLDVTKRTNDYSTFTDLELLYGNVIFKL